MIDLENNDMIFDNLDELCGFVLTECHDIHAYEFTKAGDLEISDENFTIRAVYYLDTLMRMKFPKFGGILSLVIDSSNLEIEKGFLIKMNELTSITIYGDLTELCELPPNLQKLSIEDNDLFTTLPELPDSLIELDISYTKVLHLPNLPQNLERIILWNTPLSEIGGFDVAEDRADVEELWNNYKDSMDFESVFEAVEIEKDIQVYFSHPSDTFRTDVEMKSIELINIYFENPYIENTMNDKIPIQELPEINTLVILPYSNNRITRQMYNDVQHAFEKNMEVYWLSPTKYKIYKKDSIDFFVDKIQNDIENNLEEYFV